jgi:hypothetical protein
MIRDNPMKIVKCIVCWVEFPTGRGNTSICSSICKIERKREQERRRYAANCEQILERQRRYYAANPEKKRVSARRYYAANPEKKRVSVRRWNAANPEKKRKSMRRWRVANPEKERELMQRYSLQATAAVQVFRKLIGPCRIEDGRIAKRILQQLGEQSHHNATSRVPSEHPARRDAANPAIAGASAGAEKDDGWG